MRTLIRFLFILAFCAPLFAADRVTATITITNAPADADTITINASTRTWKTTVATPTTQIAIGADAGAAATNLYRHLSSYALAGPVILGFSSSNVITILGQSAQAMAASLSAAYGTVSYTTNTVTAMYMVRVPLTGETAVPQTNNPTLLAVGMGTYSQSPFATNTTLVSNLVQVDGNQTVSGSKDFTGVAKFRDALFISNNLPRIVFYDADGGADAKFATIVSDENGVGFYFEDDTYADPQTAFFISRNGLSAELVSFISPIVATGMTLSGTNHFQRQNHTSLANGSNAGIDFAGMTYVKLKAGPTAAFTINGIAGGADGRTLIIDNSIAQNMTIANDSGVEPTAANRIYTRTGSDVSTTGQGVVTLIYDSEDSRWVLVSVRD